MAPRGPLLAIDTATTVAVVATGTASGELRRERAWTAGFRHGEELLARIVELLAADGLGPADLGGIVVGTGPGAFTGLRIGLATAKTLAHELGVPIVGVSTAAALVRATIDVDHVRHPIAILLPAGPSGMVIVEAPSPGTIEAPRMLPGGGPPVPEPGVTAVAVDLAGRAAPDADERGARARAALAASLLALGAARLADGEGDDVALLVPEYVTLPRGVAASSGEVAWSLDRP